MIGCPHCGLVHQTPVVPDDSVARCARCDGVIFRGGGRGGNQLCTAIALAALICFPLGVSLPVMRLEELGHINDASVWSGTMSLLRHGQIVIGLIVLVCSVVIPVVKLAGLLLLSLCPQWLARPSQARMYRWIEIAGKWGMIDVLLVALVVAAVKLGDLVTVTPGPGVTAFGACVVLSLIASATFNPHAIWQRGSHE